MSYILDALQRAEDERERGHVPGLKSQLVPPVKRKPGKASGVRPWPALGILAVLLIGLAAWWWTRGLDASPVAAIGAPPPPSAIINAPAPPSTAPTPSVAPVPQDRGGASAEPVLPILAPPRPQPVVPKAAEAASASAAPVGPTATAGDGAPTYAPAPAVAPAPAAVPSFGQLTAEARAQLPAVNVSGSTYSQNPALRMLIANGKVVQEGQDIAPGLRLETIGPRSAVLNHQGMRYSIGY